MAISTEVVNTTFSDLRGPLVGAFVRSNPLWDQLQAKARITQSSGSLIERSFAGGAPARGVGVFQGDELLNMTRRQQIYRFRVEPHRLVVAVNIPKKELQYNEGKLAVMRLIEEYPKTVLEGTATDINSYLLTGTSRNMVFQTAELRGLLCLDGLETAGRGTGVANGLLDFQATTLQTDSVQDVAKSSAYFHFNQYRDIGGWAATGMPTLRRTFRECASYAPAGKGPDLLIMDNETYGNYEASRLSAVRVELVDDRTEKSNTLMLDAFQTGCKVYADLGLDRTTFTGDAADGVTYMLNTDYIEMPTSEAPSISEFKERVGDQDVITAIFAAQFNLICTKTPAQGCVSGGAV